MAFVQIKHAVKRYGVKLTVDHLSLSIDQGEIFGLLGPNGAGKSTTIGMIAGLLAVDQGDIIVDGISVVDNPLEVKKRIGLIPQELALFEGLTARENVAFFARLYGLRGRLLDERIAEALAFVGLSGHERDRPEALSGGMKRRLNIACAIAHRPKLIIMDEPTVGIDPQSRNHILQSVKFLNQMGSTVIYSTHYMEEVEAIGTRVGILDQGRLIACGTKSELRNQVSGEEKLDIQAASDVRQAAVEELKLHPYIDSVEVDGRRIGIVTQSGKAALQDILFVFAKHEIAIQALTRVEPDLETLFLSLTGRKLRDD
ncbi:ABC transporter ATP-binding protein [Paenibacillus contaminans]|uniref:Export ABC transporter ATP-binding protein n=1 Tax=Paenibacillus contaminans TaxID=450362 RepID=A0A329MJ81_9BACL|nr:ABC transporter ATP-binding protein [Paenibacillus contaminans]RAV19875.1 export ABC transporter ATP-binding protein [Paenibacillus contaminans]